MYNVKTRSLLFASITFSVLKKNEPSTVKMMAAGKKTFLHMKMIFSVHENDVTVHV